MNTKLALIGLGYIAFLLLSRGSLGRAASALRSWGSSATETRTPAGSSS